MITGLTRKGIAVILPEFGIEGFIDLKLENLEEKALEVEIKSKKYKLFDRIKIHLEVALKHFKK
jgi:exoribonuclease R